MSVPRLTDLGTGTEHSDPKNQESKFSVSVRFGFGSRIFRFNSQFSIIFVQGGLSHAHGPRAAAMAPKTSQSEHSQAAQLHWFSRSCSASAVRRRRPGCCAGDGGPAGAASCLLARFGASTRRQVKMPSCSEASTGTSCVLCQSHRSAGTAG